MRVNVYAEEMTDRIEIIEKEIDGHTFTALRFYLYLPVTVHRNANSPAVQMAGPFLHRAGDDDSSAVTFWGKKDLRKVLKKAIKMLDKHYAKRKKKPKKQWFRIMRNPSDLVFVKAEEFFRAQDGHKEKWGRHWKRVRATDIENARDIGQKTLPLFGAGHD